MSYTPGPWKWNADIDSVLGFDVDELRGPNDEEVLSLGNHGCPCESDPLGTPVIEVGADDARLIAQSPILLAAAKAILAGEEITFPEEQSSEAHDAVENLALAVEAATGEKVFFAT